MRGQPQLGSADHIAALPSQSGLVVAERLGRAAPIPYGRALLLLGVLFCCTVHAQIPSHPVITEVYSDPPGAHDGPVGRDPSNAHQGFIELYLPTCAQIDPALGLDCAAVQLTFYEVEGDASSSGVELVNYRFDLPPFDIRQPPIPGPGVVARPTTGVVVLAWVDYANSDAGTCAGSGLPCSVFSQDCADLTVCQGNPTALAGGLNSRVALINGGLTLPPPPPNDYVIIAMNGHHFAGTTNFPLLNGCSVGPCTGESLIQLPDEATSGVIQNGSAAYLLMNRANAGYVELYDDKDPAHQPPIPNADPALATGGVLGVSALLDALAGNDDRKFKVDRQPLGVCGDPNPANCIDLQTVLPDTSPFALLIPQIPEKDKTRLTPTVGNGYARLWLDRAKTTEDPAVADDPAVDAITAYRLIRNDGPFFPTPGSVPLTTGAPELSVANAPEQVFNVLSQTTGRPGLLTANTGGDVGIDISTSGGASSDPSVATFAAGTTAVDVRGQTLGFPTVAITPAAGAPNGSTASAAVTVSAVNTATGAAVGSRMVTVTATVLDPSTGLNAAGGPVATVELAIQPVPPDPLVLNEFLQTDVGQFLASQPDITLFETLGNSGFLLGPLQDLSNKTQMDAAIRGLPKVGANEECRNWMNPAGPPGKLDLAQTILLSAEAQSGATTYDGTVAFGVACGTCAGDGSLCSLDPARNDCATAGPCGAPTTFTDRVRALNLNVPDTQTFNGSFTPSEFLFFADGKGVVGTARSGLSNATTTRTFELLLVDTNLNTTDPLPPGAIPFETGETDDFGLVVEVLDTEPLAPVSPGQFIFLSFAGGLEGADIDSVVGGSRDMLLTLFLLDLDGLHDTFGVRSIERAILIDSGNNNGEVEIVEAYSLNPVTSFLCTVNADCDNGLFCDGVETCVSGMCQSGTPPNCNDGVTCTVDTCNDATGTCDHVPDAAQCDNGVFCDGAEACDPLLGCLAGTPVNCGDAIPCTTDLCNETTNTCDHVPDNALCGNGVFCDGVEICDVTLGCQPGSNPCPDPSVVCDEASASCVGCVSNADCADGLFCNGVETCVAGVCQAGVPPNCDDALACTVDSCDEAAKLCDHTPKDVLCDNGLFCDGIEVCVVGTGCQPGTPPDCSDGIACTVDACNETTNSCDHVADDTRCANALFCDGAETCDALFGCRAGTPVNCADAVACTADTCNEATDSCDHVADDSLCSNGLFCDGSEVCDVTLGCRGGTNPCQPGLVCDETANTCTGCLTNADCNDGLFCTGVETCSAGVCQPGTPPNCDDSIACTTDLCNETTNSCDNIPNSSLCDNGLFCDGLESCVAGVGCQPGTPPNCADALACTIDTCNETSNSCDHIGDDALCSNGLFCDGMEICDALLGCRGGTPLDCDDAIACTRDVCDEATDSCDHIPLNLRCDDGLFCDGAEVCSVTTGCVTSPPIDCNDGQPCTTDTCNEMTNTCENTPTANCACTPSSPAQPELILVGDSSNSLVISAKNRFLSFHAGDAGASQAVRVTFVSLPPPYDVWNGVQMFVGPPSDVSELPGRGLNDPIDPGAATFLAATLQCSPFFADWSAMGLVHVLHEGIIPSKLQVGGGAIEIPAVYSIQVVEASCPLTDAASYSAPLEIVNAGWGDLLKLFTAEFRAPDNTVGVDDTVGILEKFRSLPGAPIKARTDLLGVTDQRSPNLDGVISISDVVEVINAFRGGDYPFSPLGPRPCGILKSAP